MAELVDALGLGSSSRKGNGGSSPSSCTKKSGKMVKSGAAPLQAHVRYDQVTALGFVDISIQSKIIEALYKHTLLLQKNVCSPIGFYQKHAPMQYLDVYYKEHLINHLKEFLLKYCVVSYLYQTLRTNHILYTGEPRLHAIDIHPGRNACYTFTFTPLPATPIRDWRYLLFRAPQRKRYKDIDKQAQNFIVEENMYRQNNITPGIKSGDWVLFSVILLNKQNNPIVKDLYEYLWIKISDEETNQPFHELFLGKVKGDRFVSDALCLHEYFSNQIDTQYTFGVTIKEVLPYAYFCLESFKNQFKLKTDRKLHQKIVEIYSSRNDLSLRRALVEEALATLLRIYPVQTPESAVLRQEKMLREELQHNPDYTVYKLQPDFNQKVRSLAHKQVQEHLLLTHIAIHERVDVEDNDVYAYLNLTKRPRTKEFIYYLHPAIRANEDEIPISHESLKNVCVHEKILNHVLHHLMQ